MDLVRGNCLCLFNKLTSNRIVIYKYIIIGLILEFSEILKF